MCILRVINKSKQNIWGQDLGSLWAGSRPRFCFGGFKASILFRRVQGLGSVSASSRPLFCFGDFQGLGSVSVAGPVCLLLAILTIVLKSCQAYRIPLCPGFPSMEIHCVRQRGCLESLSQVLYLNTRRLLFWACVLSLTLTSHTALTPDRAFPVVVLVQYLFHGRNVRVWKACVECRAAGHRLQVTPMRLHKHTRAIIPAESS
ncbi:hypothetical protein ElyMa_006858100 [Elysia marginata]|uniref:Uncharacterized protein n=1 Tax=Elysia marginata TaxID=1093978 RepID=A0AAV4JBU3_9GAST|nr:hypothetical protein ElyMa_006858100 [Elysia marginata]